jgi:phosphopentomutase
VKAALEERRAVLLVLDGVGAGEAPDAALYGDSGSNTLGNLAQAVGGMELPALESLGLGRVLPLSGVSERVQPLGAWGRMTPASAGKDSTTGHWELAGVQLERPFPTYPQGFPPSVIAEFERRTGRKVIGNLAGSGTELIERFAPQQLLTGAWIVYTSADSVFQIAAHEDVIPVDELYQACAVAREILVAPHAVARVIARPFTGSAGSYVRTPGRRDWALPPPAPTLLDALQEAGVPRQGVGKVDDLFAGRGIAAKHTADNAEGIAAILEWLRGGSGGLLFANLVDFDQRFGHRNDVAGFYQALREFDAALAELLAALRRDDLLFVTADHGNDPTTPSTDHSRERVPLLLAGPRVRAVNLGERDTFADVGATIAEWFGIAFRGSGSSFLREVTD